MNLFRSEEHVKSWPQYDPVSAESIMPLASWALAFSGPLFRKRRQQDYLCHVQQYGAQLFATLKELGRSGPFWVPQ